MKRPLPLAAALALGLLAARAQAQDDAGEADDNEVSFTPAEPAPALSVGGWVDIGWFNAQGDGTSFAPQDLRLPADYGVDTFAPAVNSFGEVASTNPRGRFTNGFLPRSVEADGRPTFLLNSLSGEARYAPQSSPFLVFARVHLLPRFSPNGGNQTRLFVEQAFGKVTPFSSQELTLSAGKFDSVFGIEYLDNPAPVRAGVTPSLLARYTTGQLLGAKLFYRRQIAPLWSAVSLNVAVANNAPFIEALQPAEVSLTGRPVVSGRLGYELNLPDLQVKFGGSAFEGPRNDQGARGTRQRAAGADGRLFLFGLSLAGEWLHLDQEEGPAADKRTGAGPQTIASGFHVRAFYALASYDLPWKATFFRRFAPYARYERRHAWFEGFTPLTVARLTVGARLDLGETLSLKGEYLLNRELDGAPTVDNDVLTTSLVFAF